MKKLTETFEEKLISWGIDPKLAKPIRADLIWLVQEYNKEVATYSPKGNKTKEYALSEQEADGFFHGLEEGRKSTLARIRQGQEELL